MSNPRKIISSHHPKKHLNSFSYAFFGLKHVFIQERNFRLHLFIAICVVILGYFYKLNPVEWGLISVSIAIVLICESINTIIEDLMDFISPAYSEEVKNIKDLSAGFVFISALSATFVGITIFAPKILISL